MAKTIFKILNDNAKCNTKLHKILHEFMLQGGYSKSKVDQFICENYMLSVEKLTEKWNLLNPDKHKAKITFTGQQSVISNKMLHLFGTNASELESLILTDDTNDEVYKRIWCITTSIGVSSEPLEERFNFTLQKYLGDEEPQNDYEVSECQKEIELLKLIDKSNLEALFKEVDRDKLNYIMRMMKAELILYDAVDYEKKDKKTKDVLRNADGSIAVRRVYYPVINDLKMELLLRFNAVKARRLKVVKQKEEISSEIGVELSEPVMEITSDVPKPVDNEFGLNISQEQLTLLLEKERKISKDNVVTYVDYDLVDKYKEYLRSLSIDSNIDEFKTWLSTVDEGIFSVTLDELSKR